MNTTVRIAKNEILYRIDLVLEVAQRLKNLRDTNEQGLSTWWLIMSERLKTLERGCKEALDTSLPSTL